MGRKRDKEKNRIYSAKKRAEGQQLVEIQCKNCSAPVFCKAYRVNRVLREGGGQCKSCLSKKSSDILKELRSKQTPEERSLHAKKARAKVKNTADAVKKQWETIKNNPELYQKTVKIVLKE